MEVTITAIRLRKWWHYFPLTFNAMKIIRQCFKEQGFKGYKNTGFGYLHFTMSLWETPEDRKHFYTSGAHLHAMQITKNIATEIWTYTYPATAFPVWKDAKKMLMEKGKVIRF